MAAQFTDFRQHLAHERLTAIAGVHRHEQHLVAQLQVRKDRRRRSLRPQHQPGSYATCADDLESGPHITVRFDMKLESLRPGIDKALRIEVRPRHHQMHITVEVWHDPPREHRHVRPKTQIGHKVRVHDIEMQRIGPGLLDPPHLLSQMPKIRCQQRWKNLDLHRRLNISNFSPRRNCAMNARLAAGFDELTPVDKRVLHKSYNRCTVCVSQ